MDTDLLTWPSHLAAGTFGLSSLVAPPDRRADAIPTAVAAPGRAGQPVAVPQRQPEHSGAARPAATFYFISSRLRRLLQEHEKSFLFSMLWQCVNRRPIPGLHAGSGRMQTAGHDWPIMSLL